MRGLLTYFFEFILTLKMKKELKESVYLLESKKQGSV